MTSILNWDLWQRINPPRKIDLDYNYKKEENMSKFEVCLGVGLNQLFPEKIIIDLNETDSPCNFDHNGECLICDCWPENCAHDRYLKGDYSLETKEELEELFKPKKDE